MRFPVRTAVILVALAATASAAEPEFRVEEISGVRLTVGYAVELVDVNGNGLRDIVIVDSERVIWLENPTWKLHTMIEGATKRDNVCLAPHDITGDGRLDFALGADWTLNTHSGGTIQWLTPGENGEPAEPWQVHFIGEEPTVHRMRWADIDGDGRQELIVVPLLGRETTRPHFAENPVRVLAFKVPDNPRTDRWPMQVLNAEMHVTHNLLPTDLTGNGRTDLLVVSYEGVNLLERDDEGDWQRTRIGEGDQQSTPSRGASEIARGRLADGTDYLATIEPWHGNQVVVYTPPADGNLRGMWRRQVIDRQLQWGHAVSTADLNGDGQTELIAGVRDDGGDGRRGVRIYARQPDGDWRRTFLDPGGVAVEDLAAADLNGNGRPDIVAVGRQTRNVRIYWNEPPDSP